MPEDCGSRNSKAKWSSCKSKWFLILFSEIHAHFRDRHEKERLLREKAHRESEMKRMRGELEALKKKRVDMTKKAKEEQKK